MATGSAPTNMQKEQVRALFADYLARVQIISLMYTVIWGNEDFLISPNEQAYRISWFDEQVNLYIKIDFSPCNKLRGEHDYDF